VQAQEWGRAQRELERAAREQPDGPAADDLASVRAVRRQLRILQKWPRDPQAYLALGRAYMDLGLGEDAERAFLRAVALAPEEPAPHYLLALEYFYREATDEAERAYARARALADDLPPFAEWRANLACLAEEAPPPA
jgi:tetratricopeptide (TPR) repeat protein